MQPKPPVPLSLKLLGVLLVGAIVTTMVLGQLREPFLAPVMITAAGLLILLGLCLVADFGGSGAWLGQHAKDNASMFFNRPGQGSVQSLGRWHPVRGAPGVESVPPLT